MKYFPSDEYRASYEKGLEYEDFVFDLLRRHGLTVTRFVSAKWQRIGECSGGVEVKFDDRLCETGNLYIETGEKSRPRPGEYVPSGIYREDNSWLYAIGNYDEVYIFAKTILRLLKSTGRYTPKSIPTSEGFLLPRKDARRYAATVLRPPELGKEQAATTQEPPPAENGSVMSLEDWQRFWLESVDAELERDVFK